MNHLEAIRRLTEVVGNDPIIASLGHPSYDLSAAAPDRGANFCCWGSMGSTSSIGLGLALARPDLRVFVLAGDGSLLMHLGALSTIGWNRPANLVIVVCDNAQYGTTGGQDTATAHGTDLEAAARSMNITNTATVRTEDELTAALGRAREQPGPWVIVAKVTETAHPYHQPFDCVAIKQRFMAATERPESATTVGLW